MPALTENSVKKYWALIMLVAGLTGGGAVWATNVWASIGRLNEKGERLEKSLDAIGNEVRRMRIGMERAGTSIPEGG